VGGKLHKGGFLRDVFRYDPNVCAIRPAYAFPKIGSARIILKDKDVRFLDASRLQPSETFLNKLSTNPFATMAGLYG